MEFLIELGNEEDWTSLRLRDSKRLESAIFFTLFLKTNIKNFQKIYKFDIEVLPIWTRRPGILKIDSLWKTQNQKFKTPKQAIKFVKTLNQTFKLHYPAIYEFRKCI